MADSEEPSSVPGDPLPPTAKPLPPAPRVNPPNVNAPKDAPPPGGPPGFTDFLDWMRTQAAGDPAPGPATQRGLIPKERKKFQRRDTDAKSDQPAEPPAAAAGADKQAPAAASLPSASAAPNPAPAPLVRIERPEAAKGLATSAELPVPRVRRQQVPLKRNAWLGLLIPLAALVVIVGSFVLGRISVTKAFTPPAAPAAPEVLNSEGKMTTKLLSEANAALIDQAMAAEQNGDFKRAEELLEQVKASGEHIRGLAFQLAQLAVFQRNFNRALPLLNGVIAEGENIDDAYNLRATLIGYAGSRRGSAGMNDYETATKLEPFGARTFFYWGEGLRRLGKDQAAIMRLQQAIDRLREPELESGYRLKLRLAQLEAGREEEFAGELAKQLALPTPNMDWLITAAAVAIYHGNFPAAAGYLDRARQCGDADTFGLRLRDYYLAQFRDKPEVARFYPKSGPVKPDGADRPPAAVESPTPTASGAPAVGLDVPELPPPAATLPR